jgi:hypothetical protein
MFAFCSPSENEKRCKWLTGKAVSKWREEISSHEHVGHRRPASAVLFAADSRQFPNGNDTVQKLFLAGIVFSKD